MKTSQIEILFSLMDVDSRRDIFYTPWRLPYIRSFVKGRSITCFFCQYLQEGEDKDDLNLVVYRTRHSLVVMNRYPYSRGHILVAPKRHVPSIVDLEGEELEDYVKTVKACILAVRNLLRPDEVLAGINIGRVAGAGLEEHLHVHVIPRWYSARLYLPLDFDEEEIYRDMQNICRTLREELRRVLQDLA